MVVIDMSQSLHPATADPRFGRRETQEKRSFFFWNVVLHEDGNALIVRKLLLVA